MENQCWYVIAIDQSELKCTVNIHLFALNWIISTIGSDQVHGSGGDASNTGEHWKAGT